MGIIRRQTHAHVSDLINRLMKPNELYLKTLFCCSACDGEITPEEVSLVKELALSDATFANIDAENILNSYVEQINAKGNMFLKEYLSEVSNTPLSDEEQVKLVELAIKMIEADKQVLYSEIRFFKKIRNRLSVEDDAILKRLPDCEEYLLPDITSESKDFEELGNFARISFG